MRINDAYRDTPRATDAGPARVGGPAASAAGASEEAAGVAGAGAPVTVNVSDKARELSSQTADASTSKVAKLQSALADGTFKVDPQLIAQRIVGED
jgi:negative regulator of flagellin synthesis FlgM